MRPEIFRPHNAPKNFRGKGGCDGVKGGFF